MDDTVLRAMARWPAVPAVYGWLSLSRRGHWRLRGEAVTHPGLVAFINRNYGRDERGAWFFQNGPQRVFVALATAPLILRLGNDPPSTLEAHTGMAVSAPQHAWIDSEGNLLLATEAGPAALDDRDLTRVCACLTDARGRSLAAGAALDDPTLRLHLAGATLGVDRIAVDEVERRLGFIRDPAPPRPAPTAAELRPAVD